MSNIQSVKLLPIGNELKDYGKMKILKGGSVMCSSLNPTTMAYAYDGFD